MKNKLKSGVMRSMSPLNHKHNQKIFQGQWSQNSLRNTRKLWVVTFSLLPIYLISSERWKSNIKYLMSPTIFTKLSM